jgi:hypothetical protein
MPILAYNLVNSVIIKNAIMLSFMHNILNLCETYVYYASIKEKKWHQPLFKYQIAHNRYSSEIIVTLNQNQIANTIFQLLSWRL